MRPNLRPDTEVLAVHAYLRGLSFYLQRMVTVVDENADDIRPRIPSHPSGFIAGVGSFEQRWRNAPSALAVVDPALMPQLRADGLPTRILGQVAIGIVIQRPVSSGAAAL